MKNVLKKFYGSSGKKGKNCIFSKRVTVVLGMTTLKWTFELTIFLIFLLLTYFLNLNFVYKAT